MATCSLSNPERDCHRVLVKQFELTLKVERSTLGKMSHIPLLLIRHWFAFLIQNSCIHILHGLDAPDTVREETILQSFWCKFRELHPTHMVFQQADMGRLLLKRCIPLLIHGDEGRGRKHVAHFVLSFHSMLGFGFKKDQSTPRKRKRERMECNFEGHTYTNRYLIATLRKRDYSDEQSEVWKLLMNMVAEESRFMWEVGVANDDGRRYWGIVVGLIGDWPFLHKCGGFSRSFNNIQRRAVVRSEPVGICHLCRAGQRNVSFEQLETRRPVWLSTMFVQDPFVEISPFAEKLLHEPGREAALWCFDWFHTMHLGVMKNFIGSVLALLSLEEPYGSIDDRFAALSESYKLWCHQNVRRCHVAKLTKEMIGWETTSQYPTGTWHKGSLSTVLMEYLEYRFSQRAFQDHELLGLAGEACFAIQRCSRALYRSGVWIEPQEAYLISELGFKFLRRYCQMASLSKRLGKSYFIFQPKIHVLHHFLVDLHAASQRNIASVNPLAKSCQQSEDFIGRPARLSRRVTAQKPVLHRIMDRYLQSAYHKFIKCKYLVRP